MRPLDETSRGKGNLAPFSFVAGSIGARSVVPTVIQDSFGIPFGIVELMRPQGPDEGRQARRAQAQRNWDKHEQNLHEASSQSRNRRAFSVTETELSDMAKAAIRGVTKPATASGTATTL